jgi:hypothetical protein
MPEVGDDGYLYQGLSSILFPVLLGKPQPKSIQNERISVLDYLQEIGLGDWPDERFCMFIERIVHPEVQQPDTQIQLVAQFNSLLQQDLFELRQEDSQGGLPVYKVRRKEIGVDGQPKYIIFASKGPKPDIIINDAVNMVIRVVRFGDQCLVYDEPPPHGDLTWQMLVVWWGKKILADPRDDNTRRDIGLRLRSSLQSEPEVMLYDTYFKMFKPIFGMSLPALLPQVYLHYDPRNQNERREPVLKWSQKIAGFDYSVTKFTVLVAQNLYRLYELQKPLQLSSKNYLNGTASSLRVDEGCMNDTLISSTNHNYLSLVLIAPKF